MSIRWTIGAAIAVLAGFLVLPGVASAHHVDLQGQIICNDGTWNISADYIGGSENRIILVDVEGVDFETDGGNNPTSLPAGMTASVYDENVNPADQNSDAFNWRSDRDRFEIDGHGGLADSTDSQENFFILSGDYDSIDALPDHEVTVEMEMYAAFDVGGDGNSNDDQALDDAVPGPGNPQVDADGVADGDLIAEQSLSTSDFDECIIDVCVNGDNDAEQLEFKATPTNDCDPVRVCFDGESLTVTEFAAESLEGAEDGSCTPTETPVPPTPGEPEEPAPIQQVQEAVAEVSPVIEVVALPSAGQGNAGGVTYIWAAIAGLAVVGLGGATALMARPRK